MKEKMLEWESQIDQAKEIKSEVFNLYRLLDDEIYKLEIALMDFEEGKNSADNIQKLSILLGFLTKSIKGAI